MILNNGSTVNDWADYWRNQCGLNVFPADTRDKRTYEAWGKWQDTPISNEQHEEWKKSNSFSNGMAIIAGKVWHREDLKDHHLCFIDLDNQKAIEEICRIFGVRDIGELAKITIVEQHLDNKSKAHVYCYTKYILKKKSSDATRNLKDELDSNEIPAIEVKCQSDGIAYCTPSPHKDGHNYEIIGTTKIGTFNGKEIEDKLFAVYNKYGLLIGEGYKNGEINSNKIAIEEFFKPGFIIKEGHNRSEAVMRVAESIYAKHGNSKSLETIRQETYNWMTEHCDPPLDQTKFERQFKDGIRFVDRTTVSNKETTALIQRQLQVQEQQLKTNPRLIYKIVDYTNNSLKAYYIDENLGQICYGKLEDINILPEKGIINILPKKIRYYNNPLYPHLEPKIEIEFFDGIEIRKLGPMNSLNDLLRELHNKGYILNKAKAEDAFSSILNAMKEKDENLVEYINDVTTSGYYLIDGELLMKNTTQSLGAIEKEDAIECCELLNNLSEKGWKNKDIFPTVLKWGLLAPFSFIIKHQGSLSQWMPWLQMFGQGQSGKTTLGEIIALIWNLNPQERSAGFTNLDTPAKFGHFVSSDTYPRLVNEPGNLYTNQKGRFNGIIEMIKSSVEGITARSKFFDYKNYQEIPALSPIMFASNYSPINDGSYNRRFISIHFSKDEKKEETEQAVFKKLIQYKKQYLKVLGDFALQQILKDPHVLLKEDWKDVANKILIEFYLFAGLEKPEWIEYFVEQKDAVDESNENTMFTLRKFFMDKINETYLKNRNHNDATTVINGVKSKLEYCIKNELISFFHPMGDDVIITQDIRDEIKKFCGGIENITSLEDIGLQIGIPYTFKTINNKKRRVLCGSLSKLCEFINPDIIP